MTYKVIHVFTSSAGIEHDAPLKYDVSRQFTPNSGSARVTSGSIVGSLKFNWRRCEAHRLLY